jgi:transposase
MLHPDMSASEIAKITLFSTSRVWAIHANYRSQGLAGLIDGRGGRYRQNLTFVEEEQLLKPFECESKNGSLIVAGKVKKAYEQKIGKEVAESTIYRMLHRHGFRKITPYRRHKKADKDSQETFKKTSQI